ncbi:peptidase S66 [Paenibacillus sp. FSL R7-0273]|uniref:S66 family peptidase n=1 Tax=Paenibacillus sp. FSL R7-0273 TaxID=1536772 RepID=UPI0004F86FB8|nr:S66 peptidase family protein [Paenibacillus sp. FSL R7-0273]AIQ47902.1 peptidase S66 [Paenibacillus sp. FSL R7-0273]OMF94547.1 LD-carboxypeptidase [Paenibacillus sp. FSL R7-0273]
MITYPILQPGAVLGVTASSLGADEGHRDIFDEAVERMRQRGYGVALAETVYKYDKARSAPGRERGSEFNQMMQDGEIGLIIPPWGGELLIEMLEFIDFDEIRPKWVLGFSDISLLLLAITLRTGIATAHGPSLGDLRGQQTDETTAMWQKVLSTPSGGSIVQQSSPKHEGPEEASAEALTSPFGQNTLTVWKSVSGQDVSLKGRLLGGCIDVIRHIIGTPYGDVQRFNSRFAGGEPIVWYLENCDLNTADLRRSLVHMKYAGWFENCSGILFGRSGGNQPLLGYTAEDVYRDLAEDLQLPVLYDLDFGHVPPQMTLVNGAYAEVEVAGGRGTVKQYFYE